MILDMRMGKGKVAGKEEEGGKGKGGQGERGREVRGTREGEGGMRRRMRWGKLKREKGKVKARGGERGREKGKTRRSKQGRTMVMRTGLGMEMGMRKRKEIANAGGDRNRKKLLTIFVLFIPMIWSKSYCICIYSVRATAA
jgi:hypothetical protein